MKVKLYLFNDAHAYVPLMSFDNLEQAKTYAKSAKSNGDHPLFIITRTAEDIEKPLDETPKE